MKLETPFRMVVAAGLALIVWTSGCNTRTPIGEIPDAGEGSDGWPGDGSLSHGSGGVAGGQGGGGGYPASSGGAQARGGDTGDAGGVIGNGGGRTGQGGAAGGSAMGGTAGTGACRTYETPKGAAGQMGTACSDLIYPASGFYGDNILADGCSAFTSSVNYDLAVTLPSTSATVQVTVTKLSVSGAAGRSGSSGWYYGNDGDWRVKTYDPQTQTQLYQTRPISDNETLITFMGAGTARVDIYECDLTTPARSKTISWAPASP